MGRTILSKDKLVFDNNAFIGKIILFCEGMTEKNYFEYFTRAIKNKYTNISIEVQKAGGNARGVLNYANNFLDEEENNRKYKDYDKYLVFDCDAPEDIQSVIKDAINDKKEYKLLTSNLLFETWLLMHFENVEENFTKTQTYTKMAMYLNVEKYDSKEKAKKGNIRKIVQDNNVEKAIDNAEKMEKYYESFDISNSIAKMNPFTEVHKLVKQLMIEISK